MRKLTKCHFLTLAADLTSRGAIHNMYHQLDKSVREMLALVPAQTGPKSVLTASDDVFWHVDDAFSESDPSDRRKYEIASPLRSLTALETFLSKRIPTLSASSFPH